jgi:hypothetical protein
MSTQIIRDIITRMWATGDKHDQHMSEMATEQLDRLEAELARKDAIEAAASDVAKNWFSDRQRTGWAMDNLVNALERKS